MRTAFRFITGGLVALALVITAGSTANAANGDTGGTTTQSGYTVTAAVDFSGDAAPGGGGTVHIGVPAQCWWGTADAPGFNAADPSSWVKWREDYVAGLGSSSTVSYWYYSLASPEAFAAAAAAAQSGKSMTLYVAQCVDDDPCSAKLAKFVGGDMNSSFGCTIPVTIQFFATGATPQPQIDPYDLAILAREHMQIDTPQVDRNPKAQAPAGATFVGLPTWFWVTNPASVAVATGGVKTIRAAVGNTWASVTASTDGLSLSSPAGSTTCSPQQSIVSYQGEASGTACSIEFSKASVGYPAGYPVTASTTWGATYQLSDGRSGGLDGLARQTVVNVPVAESQAIVR